MRIVALLTVRNEELYLERCLAHLYSQGIETCLIDNGSNDRTLEIAQTFIGRGVFRIEHLPYNGYFELKKILQNEERLASEIHADWFMHHDADEIREAPYPYKTLLEGIKTVDYQGYNAINFDEFVFIPTCEHETYENTDYLETMQYYYFFEPSHMHQIKGWKKTNAQVNLKGGGHQVEFKGRKIFPIPFVLRHYIILSRKHAITKYCNQRIYTRYEVEELGWHKERANYTADKFKFPCKGRLKKISKEGIWDKSEPWFKHGFINSN